jgi:TRAP-type C4-dicarboxylate transport system permease small subunit
MDRLAVMTDSGSRVVKVIAATLVFLLALLLGYGLWTYMRTR